MDWQKSRGADAVPVDRHVVQVDRVGHDVETVVHPERLVVGRSPVADIFDAAFLQHVERAFDLAHARAEPATHGLAGRRTDGIDGLPHDGVRNPRCPRSR